MLSKDKQEHSQIEFFSIDNFVPQEHLLRKIDSAVDFTHIYDIVSDLYCSNNGRPSIDPVVLFKMVIIQYLWNYVIKKNSGRSKNECCLSLVSRLSYERADTSFFNNKL